MLGIHENRDYLKIFQDMVMFLKNLGLNVHTNTKARGHQGFFLRDRIDISVNLSDKRKIEVLIHEFTHYIHYQIDNDVFKNHGSLSCLFPNSDLNQIEDELYNVTRFVDTNKSFKLLEEQRARILDQIKSLDKNIKINYPDFKRSYDYPLFIKSINKTDAKYLLKYDRVQVKTMFFGANKIYSIQNIDIDFPSLDSSIKDYIRLKALQRKLKRISARLNKLEKYYKRPTELFARFVEGLFIDTNKVAEIAPYTYLVFCNELSKNRYLYLADFINKFF